MRENRPLPAASVNSPDALLAMVHTDPSGLVAPGVYDTARLVALAPWLAGHQARLSFLLRAQRADGAWGAADGYAVVPTLSATGALLTELCRARPGGAARAAVTSPRPGPDRLADAAAQGLAALRRLLDPERPAAIPDTIAVEYLVPALVDEINQRLAALATGTTRWPLPDRLRCRSGPDPAAAAAARAALAAGHPLPQRAWASLEAFGPTVVRASYVRPAHGAVGCSAAATAAWLGGRSNSASGRYLDRLQTRNGGPVPPVSPITYFERAWALNHLADAGVPHRVPTGMLDSLAAGLTESGAPAAPGLPTDSDDTAGVLRALLHHGRTWPPDSLLDFQRDGHFACFAAERTPSTTANAHVLAALGAYLRVQPVGRGRLGPSMTPVITWLLDRQLSDGSWSDKWHASGYYAVKCVAKALSGFGGERSAPALARAVDWVLATQRPDGAWGRWEGTIEETAYAVITLCRAAPPDSYGVADAVARGYRFLREADDPAAYPGLWHAKDLYAPVRVIQAARIAALHLAGGTHPELSATVPAFSGARAPATPLDSGAASR